MTDAGRALWFFSELADAVAEVDRKIAVVSAHRATIIQKRDHKAEQIALSEREQRMYQSRIDAAEAQLLLLVQEKSRLFGSPVKAPFEGGTA